MIMAIKVTPNDDYRWKWNVEFDGILKDHYREEVSNWCTEQFGPSGIYTRWAWYWHNVISFTDYEDVVLFQLTWG